MKTIFAITVVKADSTTQTVGVLAQPLPVGTPTRSALEVAEQAAVAWVAGGQYASDGQKVSDVDVDGSSTHSPKQLYSVTGELSGVRTTLKSLGADYSGETTLDHAIEAALTSIGTGAVGISFSLVVNSRVDVDAS